MAFKATTSHHGDTEGTAHNNGHDNGLGELRPPLTSLSGAT